MRILISPTAFKGTLSPNQAARLIGSVIKSDKPGWTIDICPVADGGDGTLEVLAAALKAKPKKTRVTGPLGKKVNATWAVTGKTALIEMARASGLALVKGKNRILDATTVGTGELIRAALKAGCRKIFIGVGGTATAEGGAGALRVLGLKYRDAKGQLLTGTPKDLLRVRSIDWAGLDPRLHRTKIFVICDVTNPLLGPHGSARVFGPQKGATASQVKFLEKALRHWSTFARFPTKKSAGAGAAGALAFGLSGFLGAQLVPGSPFVFKNLNWTKKARKADVIITGEGQLDKTSFSGKPIGQILRNKNAARLFVICGRNRLSSSEIKRRGLDGVIEMGVLGQKKPVKCLKLATKVLLVNSLCKL